MGSGRVLRGLRLCILFLRPQRDLHQPDVIVEICLNMSGILSKIAARQNQDCQSTLVFLFIGCNKERCRQRQIVVVVFLDTEILAFTPDIIPKNEYHPYHNYL